MGEKNTDGLKNFLRLLNKEDLIDLVSEIYLSGNYVTRSDVMSNVSGLFIQKTTDLFDQMAALNTKGRECALKGDMLRAFEAHEKWESLNAKSDKFSKAYDQIQI